MCQVTRQLGRMKHSIYEKGSIFRNVYYLTLTIGDAPSMGDGMVQRGGVSLHLNGTPNP